MAILTDCPACDGDIALEPGTTLLTVFRVRAGRHPLPARFSFTCPVCGEVTSATTNGDEELQLARVGVPVEVVDDPRDRHPSMAGRRSPCTGTTLDAPRFTAQDVRALRELLDREDWFERLLDTD